MIHKEKYTGFTRTKLVRRCFEKAQSIEEQVRQSVESKEPIAATKNVIFTAKREGVLPQYNPRTDKQVIAVEQFDRATQNLIMQGSALQQIEEQADQQIEEQAEQEKLRKEE